MTIQIGLKNRINVDERGKHTPEFLRQRAAETFRSGLGFIEKSISAGMDLEAAARIESSLGRIEKGKQCHLEASERFSNLAHHLMQNGSEDKSAQYHCRAALNSFKGGDIEGAANSYLELLGKLNEAGKRMAITKLGRFFATEGKTLTTAQLQEVLIAISPSVLEHRHKDLLGQLSYDADLSRETRIILTAQILGINNVQNYLVA